MTDAADRARWARVGELFHRVLETPPARRAEVLDEACAGDAALRRDVESLVDAHERPDERLNRPAATAADVLAAQTAGLRAGQRIGPYEVIDTVARGGMGVVYRAHDSRLGRDVALKALPAWAGDDPTRRERLRREARAAAALSHPGIATVFALEEIDGHVYIASEYVPGRTLREELGAGPLPPPEARHTLQAIAHALAAAHARGIVHRDLKPENVIRTGDGGVKVLDFGLARMRPAPGDTRLTEDGAVLGTPGYMAPEQLRGEEVDARADVFALGALGFELLSGRPPFDAAHQAAVVARVLESDPGGLVPPADASAIDRAAWDVVARVSRRCLQKDPAGRFASASEVAAALTSGAAPATDDVATGRRQPIWWWQFHQSAAAAGHVLLLLPLWLAGQIAPAYGLTVFLAGLAGAVAGSLLRLHLLFVYRSYPAETNAQRAATRPWRRTSDVVLAAACTAAGVLVLDADLGLASLLIGGAVAVPVAALLVEPATSRAAFGQRAPDAP